MIEVETVDAASTIKLSETIEARYPKVALVHVFLDEARQFYDLEHLWLDAPRITWALPAPS